MLQHSVCRTKPANLRSHMRSSGAIEPRGGSEELAILPVTDPLDLSQNGDKDTGRPNGRQGGNYE
jgi:hypothetical protein